MDNFSNTILLFFVIAVSGCAYFKRANDDSHLNIKNVCNVKIDQKSKTGNKQKGKVIEEIYISPDCNTKVKFKQTIGAE